MDRDLNMQDLLDEADSNALAWEENAGYVTWYFSYWLRNRLFG